jgi:hypothetical protein
MCRRAGRKPFTARERGFRCVRDRLVAGRRAAGVPAVRRVAPASRSPGRYAAVLRAWLRGGRPPEYRTARAEPAEHIPPHAIDGLLAAYRTEGFKLAATSRSVELVERALLGEAFTPRF